MLNKPSDGRDRRLFSVEEYLNLEESSEARNEFYEGEIFALTGGSLNHNRISTNLCTALTQPSFRRLRLRSLYGRCALVGS